MIFVTVGTQLPFDRMVRVVDTWAHLRGRDDVFAQIGPTEWRPSHIASVPFLEADECHRRIRDASLVVAHAGMGSILTALELGKPIVVMPRRSDLAEHRNDHQMATAKWFLAQGRIAVAMHEEELIARLDEVDHIKAGDRISASASDDLLNVLRQFMLFGRRPELPIDSAAAMSARSLVQ